MSANITLDDLLDCCPYRSIICAHGSDLGRAPGAVIALPKPGMRDPAAATIERAVDVLLAGGLVLVITADPDDRHRIRALLAAGRPPIWGRA